VSEYITCNLFLPDYLQNISNMSFKITQFFINNKYFASNNRVAFTDFNLVHTYNYPNEKPRFIYYFTIKEQVYCR